MTPIIYLASTSSCCFHRSCVLLGLYNYGRWLLLAPTHTAIMVFSVRIYCVFLFLVTLSFCITCLSHQTIVIWSVFVFISSTDPLLETIQRGIQLKITNI